MLYCLKMRRILSKTVKLNLSGIVTDNFINKDSLVIVFSKDIIKQLGRIG